ncbi:hypothetical protein ACUH96_00845 [Dermabacteraceae bacterium P13077]
MSNAASGCTDWQRTLRALWEQSTPMEPTREHFYNTSLPVWVITREVTKRGFNYSIYWGQSAEHSDNIESRQLPEAPEYWRSANAITATVPGYENRAVMFRADEDGETWQTRGGATFAADVLEDVKEVPL